MQRKEKERERGSCFWLKRAFDAKSKDVFLILCFSFFLVERGPLFFKGH